MSDFICICSVILGEFESVRNYKGMNIEKKRVTSRYHGSTISR